MEPVLDDFNENEATDTDQEPQTDTDRTDGEETNTTPSQSRSSSIRPQPHLPLDPDVDVFDGYSFKGRHSVLIDDDEEEEEEEDSSGEGSREDEDEENLSILEGLEEEAAQIGIGEGRLPIVEDVSPSESMVLEDGVEPEPKTPEARPISLPLPPVAEVVVVVPAVPAVEEIVTEVPRTTEETQVVPKVEEALPVSRPLLEVDISEPHTIIPIKENKGSVVPAKETKGSVVPAKETNGPIVPANGRSTPPPKVIPSRQPASSNNRAGRNRREKSGVPALDRYLSDAIDEDTEATEADRDEDEDWDFVEAADGEDRNGAKGTSLFARGVVDRYRLAVFRKASTPTSRSGMRSVSGISNASEATVSEMADSPSPTQRRGRTSGLPFRKHPRQFLRPKSPPSSFSAKTARSLSQSGSTSKTLSAASTSSGGLLSASHSVGSTFALSPSLKSKESAISVGAHSQSSDQSVNGTSTVFVDATDTVKGSPQSTVEHKVKNKKLRKYKNNAEKVFSLFSSPR